MAWSDLTFTGCSVLTAGQMTQLQANFGALAAADSGAPSIAKVWMHPGSASHGWIRPKLLVAQGGIAAGQAEGWHEIGAAGEPAFANSWVNYGGGEETAAFRKLATGLVALKGYVKGGTLAAAVFTLPVGYRPAAAKHFCTLRGGAGGWTVVRPDGIVLFFNGGNTGEGLNGAMFPAEQ